MPEIIVDISHSSYQLIMYLVVFLECSLVFPIIFYNTCCFCLFLKIYTIKCLDENNQNDIHKSFLDY